MKTTNNYKQKPNLSFKDVYPKTNSQQESSKLDLLILPSLKTTLEKYKEMLVLCKIREILINERNKGYYRNAANIKEQIILKKKTSINKDCVESTYEQYMITYQNEYSDFYSLIRKKYSNRKV